jgi:hypothetical protein
MAEHGAIYVGAVWTTAMLLATVFLRPLLKFFGGGRITIDNKDVRRLRVLLICAFLIGVWQLIRAGFHH